MAAKKKAAAKPDESGIESFEERARVFRETSSSARFSTTKPGPATGPLDGDIYVEERGKPKAGVKPPDEE